MSESATVIWNERSLDSNVKSWLRKRAFKPILIALSVHQTSITSISHLNSPATILGPYPYSGSQPHASEGHVDDCSKKKKRTVWDFKQGKKLKNEFKNRGEN